ncbi:hypothetical protein BDV25DRAFT_131498 [Aspergillus avenaceus]|uniref:Uncharacterized protein n=1 Tax=Aspergillus avenaceus TaxID=36643 RepID=A0A5N6TPP8_ASPAV|nr:hypothetical protein BDV25DRAFT_131498 [Aspergillus avenaceus]
MSDQRPGDPLPPPTAGWDNGPSKLELEERQKKAGVTGATDSHVLSKVDQDEKGLAQEAGRTDEITDLGWEEITQGRIVAGLSNEDLWMFIRRFNKQLYYVKAVPDAPLQRLDPNRAEDENFSPDKLRATLERFYTTIVISLASFYKHIARLRSWKEPRRTGIFCAGYFIAWALDLLVPTMFCFLITLVVYPRCRSWFFPPAPIALVDSDTGGVQKPKAGVLGSHGSITGAPERMKGEAAEQEASNLITSAATVAVGSVAGKHDQGTPESAPLESSVPDAMNAVSGAADAQAAAHGQVPAGSHDRTRQPMRETVLNGANLGMRILSDIVDTYERLGNALSPTPPFPAKTPYIRLASLLSIGLLASLVTSSYVFVKTGTLTAGFGFFGDPVLARAAAYLNHKYPDWTKLLELQNSLLKGIPTNAQLTLTLLRIGEANAAPLPPPPSDPTNRAPMHPTPTDPSDINLNATEEEIAQAAAADPQTLAHNEQEKPHAETPKKTWVNRMINFFRGTTATGIESKLAIDRARAAAGSNHAKNRLGILSRKGKMVLSSGPVEFDARYKGKRGTAVIDSSSDPPLLYFTTESVEHLYDPRIESREKGSVLFTMPVTDVRELRKIGGFGWKGKLVAGWAEQSKEVVDGLEIVGKDSTQHFQLTAMKTRNELFNRLIAIDGQVWESY